jgi:hypothetical protein
LLFNAGMLTGFFLHSLLHSADHTMEPIFLQTSSSFRDDLLMPILPAKNRYLH